MGAEMLSNGNLLENFIPFSSSSLTITHLKWHNACSCVEWNGLVSLPLDLWVRTRYQYMYVFLYPCIFSQCRWNERTGFNVYQTSRGQPNRPEENHRLYLHRQVVTEHGESTRHTWSSQLFTNSPGAGFLQGVSYIWGKQALPFTLL